MHSVEIQYSGTSRTARLTRKVRAATALPNSGADDTTVMKPEMQKNRSTPKPPGKVSGASATPWHARC
jgi:hypothetical protein